MDAKLGDTAAHRLHVTEKTSFKPFDPSDHYTTNRGVCQSVKPRLELRKRFDGDHGVNVIERLHLVKHVGSRCRAAPCAEPFHAVRFAGRDLQPKAWPRPLGVSAQAEPLRITMRSAITLSSMNRIRLQAS